MEGINWDSGVFFLAFFILVVIQFLEEYWYHKKIDFKEHKKYTTTFWIFNSLYVIFGAVASTLLASIMKNSDPFSVFFYAGSWEGYFGKLSKKEGGFHEKSKY